MIHVDHHPTTLSKNSTKNDILWSHQKPFTQDFLPQRPDTPSSPTSLPDGNSTSPTREERSSSLSPPPEPTTATSPQMSLAEEKEAPLENLQREEEEEEDPSLNVRTEVEEDEELTQFQKAEEESKVKESRQSTPLSELSPPPDEPDEHDTELTADTQPADVESSSSPLPGTSSPPKSAVDNTRSGSSNSTRTLRSMSSKSPTHLQPQPPSQSQAHPKPLPQQQQQQLLIPSTSSNHTPSIDHITPTTITTTPALLQDPKVVSILEVNVELLKYVLFLHFVVFIIVITNHQCFSITNDLSFLIEYVCYFKTRASQLQICDSDSKLFYFPCVHITNSVVLTLFLLVLDSHNDYSQT